MSERPRRKVVARSLLGLALLALLAIVPGLIYLESIGVTGASSPRGKVAVAVPEGATVSSIGELLEDKGVVRSALGFRIAAFLREGAEGIQAGNYRLRRGLTARDALAALLKGPKIEFVTVTFPEGAWLVDFADTIAEETHIARRAFFKLVTSGKVRSKLQPPDVDTLEGLLFPSTYQVIERDTARSLTQRLVSEFEERARDIDWSDIRRAGMTPYEGITIASMIEAEAARDEERGKIAAVIYNRLRRGMPLGIDATVQYALGEHKESLTASDLEIDSPYNTRRVVGLPPTPIGAPGVESLQAAADPAEGEWLYYVLSDCEGHHAFSVSYDDFLEDKAAYEELHC